MKIRNTSASTQLKITETIHRETTLAPGEELTTDPDTAEIEIEVQP